MTVVVKGFLFVEEEEEEEDLDARARGDTTHRLHQHRRANYSSLSLIPFTTSNGAIVFINAADQMHHRIHKIELILMQEMRKCSDTIAAKTLRLGLVTRDARGGFHMTKWHHLQCFPFDSHLD
ncbi:hypothetical protein ACFE04_004358 [Oxalis oulophora]